MSNNNIRSNSSLLQKVSYPGQSNLATPVAGSNGEILFNNNGVIGSNSNLFFDEISNRVGIGTSSPAHPLEIVASASNAKIRSSTSGQASYLQLQNSADSRNAYVYATGLELRLSQADNTAGSQLTFYTRNSLRMTLDDVGNLGIGITPVVSLDVNGRGRFLGVTSGSSGALTLRANANGNPAYIQWVDNTNSTERGWLVVDETFNMRFATGSTEKMRIDTNGNVTIGNSGLTEKLSLYNSGASNTALRWYQGGVQEYWMGMTSGSGILRIGQGSGYGSTLLVLDSSGNLGIGAIPATRSHIEGLSGVSGAPTDAGSKQATLRLTDTSNTAGSGGSIEFGGQAGKYHAAIKSYLDNGGSNTTGSLRFYTRNAVGDTSLTERMSIDYLGNLSLGKVYVDLSANSLRPFVDNATALGTGGFRYTVVYATTGTINTSDQREKTDISPSSLGLNFINQLNPVQYKWIEGTKTEEVIEGEVTTVSIPGVRTHFGLISQEVKSAIPNDLDFAGWILEDKNDLNSRQGLRYSEFIAPMIKAIQELSAENNQLKADLAAIKTHLGL